MQNTEIKAHLYQIIADLDNPSAEKKFQNGCLLLFIGQSMTHSTGHRVKPGTPELRELVDTLSRVVAAPAPETIGSFISEPGN